MSADADIVDDFMRALQRTSTPRSLAELWRLERHIRDQYGGQRYYIQTTTTVERRRTKS